MRRATTVRSPRARRRCVRSRDDARSVAHRWMTVRRRWRRPRRRRRRASRSAGPRPRPPSGFQRDPPPSPTSWRWPRAPARAAPGVPAVRGVRRDGATSRPARVRADRMPSRGRRAGSVGRMPPAARPSADDRRWVRGPGRGRRRASCAGPRRRRVGVRPRAGRGDRRPASPRRVGPGRGATGRPRCAAQSPGARPARTAARRARRAIRGAGASARVPPAAAPDGRTAAPDPLRCPGAPTGRAAATPPGLRSRRRVARGPFGDRSRADRMRHPVAGRPRRARATSRRTRPWAGRTGVGAAGLGVGRARRHRTRIVNLRSRTGSGEAEAGALRVSGAGGAPDSYHPKARSERLSRCRAPARRGALHAARSR